jgi:hypothetical protein
VARVPFVGESFSLLAPAASAAASINCFPEIIDDPSAAQKNKDIIRFAPGLHLLKTLTHGNVRGLWSGGGRLFVISGAYLYEVGQGTYPTLGGGTIISSQNLGANDTLPAQMFGNGNQLGIVANGLFYIDNGTGAVIARFQLSGTVTIAGTAVTWQSGDKFPTYTPSAIDPLPTVIFINSNPVAVTFLTATTATLAVAIAGGSGVGTYYGSSGDLLWASGAQTFDPSWVGLPIVIGGITYTIASWINQYHITTLEQPGGPGVFGQAWSVSLAGNTYSTAGGDQVTAVTGAYLDGSFFVQRPITANTDLGRQVNFSAVNDGTSWRGIDFFTKEGGADWISSIISDHELLYVFGTEESEVWQNDPNTGLPVRLQGAAAREGCPATWSPSSLSETIYFIGGSPRGGPIAYRLNGFVPQRISTHAVEQAWSYAVVVPGGVEGVSYSYIDQGHKFWVVNFAGNTGTWVYDETASALLGSPQWHQRSSGGLTGTYQWWFHTYIPEWGTDGMHIVGETSGADLCEMNMQFADEEGLAIQWQRALPYRWNGGNYIYFGRMDLEMATGLVASGAEPTIARDYSDDRGQTFVNSQTAGIGVHAAYTRRVFWPCGGSSRGRVWRFTGTSQQPGALIDLNCEDTNGVV